MDNPNRSDPGLTEDDRLRLGAQQAAIIHLQEVENVRRQHVHEISDHPMRHPMRGPPHDSHNNEQSILRGREETAAAIEDFTMQMQAAAMAEKEKEAEMMHHQQMVMMMRPPQGPQPPPSQQHQQPPPPAMAPPPAPPGMSGPPPGMPPAPTSTMQPSAPPPPPPHLMGQPPMSGSMHMAPPPPGMSSQHMGPPPTSTQGMSRPPPGPPPTSQPPPSQHMAPPNMSQPPGPPGPSGGPPGIQSISSSQQYGGPPPIKPPPPGSQMQPPPNMPPPSGRMLPRPPPGNQPGPPGLSTEHQGPPGFMGEQGPPRMPPPPRPNMGGPPPNMEGPPPSMGGPPPPSMGGPPPPNMGGPPPNMEGPPPSMGGPGPPPSMGGPGPRPSMTGPPPRPNMVGPPPNMSGPPPPPRPSMAGPPPRPNMSGPPPNISQPPPGFQSRPPPPVPPGEGPPRSQSQGPPPTSQPMDTQASQAPLPDPEKPRELKLPQALEKVLAFKGIRASQVGVAPEDIEKVEKGEVTLNVEVPARPLHVEMPLGDDYGDDDEDEEVEPVKETSKKESKNKKRKKKKKKARQRKLVPMNKGPLIENKPADNVEIEYIQEDLGLDISDPLYYQFNKIFEKFKIAEPEKEEKEAVKEVPKKEVPIKARGILDSSDDEEEEDEQMGEDDDKPKISKKKMKKLNRLSVAELKQLVTRPDVVEMHDVTARDPKLLVLLKATRNTVTVPRHWCFKRKYLQGKRGIEKPPFELPEYIKQTGIMEMRAALAEKEDQKSMKQKMRERVRPKMGKIDIDYQKLHDAFFKWQIKPKMTIHGDLYYEGKEFETRLKEKKPGNLSDDLRTALGMPIGANADKVPPPWLIAMQRYGPPPSYPNLKIPGLNAPIPEGCSFGYHAGGWGKPPVDESGKPLYGDVFGVQGAEIVAPVAEEEIDKSHWGELESESESEEESDEGSDEDGMEADMTGLVTPGETGLVTPSGVTSVPIGVETPDMIELRKQRIEDAIDAGGDTPALYTILPEKKMAVGAAMMGSAHVYDISAVASGGMRGRPGPGGTIAVDGIDVALNPEELDLDTAAMQAKYEQTMREQQQSQLEKEDLSDMVAEHAAKQHKKRKKQQQDSGKAAKKYKDFKF